MEIPDDIAQLRAAVSAAQAEEIEALREAVTLSQNRAAPEQLNAACRRCERAQARKNNLNEQLSTAEAALRGFTEAPAARAHPGR